jgi:hypothetical protein
MSLAQFLRTDDPSWMRALELCEHDIYHLPAYASLEADWIKAEAMAFRFDNDRYTMVLPLLVRPTPGGIGFDAVTPYGYSSPVFTHGAPFEFMNEALQAYQAAALERGLITTFMRLHPILLEDLQGIIVKVSAGSWTQIARGVTLTMPLSGEHDVWIKTVSNSHRRAIQRLLRNGCVFLLDSDEAWNSFPKIYRSTMERVGAMKSYYYSDEYLAGFRHDLSQYVHCGAVLDPAGEVMSAGLFTNVSGILQYHLGGTEEKFTKHSPLKLLFSSMRNWAQEHKMKHFHLGGGLGSAKDSLYEFKQQFGGDTLTFRTVSVVHDEKAFMRECDHWCELAQVKLVESNGFFPPYRAPNGK